MHDFSENDLEDEEDDEDEDEEEDDMEDEECQDDDIMSSTMGDEDDNPLCSPMTGSEEKNNPSQKQNQILTSSIKSPNNADCAMQTDKDVMGKSVKGGKTTDKRNSPDNHNKCLDKKSTTINTKPTGTGRAKSLPPNSSVGYQESLDKNSGKCTAKGRKRKSRPSSSSPLLEDNGDESKLKTQCSLAIKENILQSLKSKKKRISTPSPNPPKIASGKNNSQNHGKSSQNTKNTSNAHVDQPCKATKENMSSAPVISLPASVPSSCKNSTSAVLDPRNVWWANAVHAAAVSSAEIGGDRSSSVASGPIHTPEIPISQWSNSKCASPPSQTGIKEGVQAAALTASVVTNPTITPPPGPSTAMAELANLVNAHPRAGVGVTGETVHDMRPFLRNLAAQQQKWTSVEATTPGRSGNNANCGLSDDNDSGPFR